MGYSNKKDKICGSATWFPEKELIWPYKITKNTKKSSSERRTPETFHFIETAARQKCFPIKQTASMSLQPAPEQQATYGS